MGRKKIKKDIVVDARTLDAITQKLSALEAQLEEKTQKLEMYEEKVDAIESASKKEGVGTQTYGFSNWKSWVNGSEKGYHRQCFVDIKSVIVQRSSY